MNIYNIKYMNYEATFHNESNNIDLSLCMLIFFSISLVKIEIL